MKVKKSSLSFLLISALMVGTAFTPLAANASVSVKSLENEIKSLEASNSSLQKQLAAKNSAYSSLQKQLTSESNENASLEKQLTSDNSQINSYKANAVTPLQTKLGYNGNVSGSYYQEGNLSVPMFLSYKGLRYAPVDAVASYLNINSYYNKTTDTFYFGNNPNGIYLSDILTPFHSDNEVDTNSNMTMGGINYNKGYKMYGYNYKDSNVNFNLNNQYSQLTGLIGIDDTNSDTSGDKFVVKFFDDKNNLIATYNIIDGQLPISVNIPVNGVSNLTITITCPVSGYEGPIDFANVIAN